jgi:predicted nucleotidyltransferase
LTGPLGIRLRGSLRQLFATAADFGVRNLRVFGSVARGEDGADSDLDLLADLPVDLGLLGLGRLRAALEDIIGAPVDIVPATDLKPQVRPRGRAGGSGPVTYRDQQRIADILAAIEAIRAHLLRGGPF